MVVLIRGVVKITIGEDREWSDFDVHSFDETIKALDINPQKA